MPYFDILLKGFRRERMEAESSGKVLRGAAWTTATRLQRSHSLSLLFHRSQVVFSLSIKIIVPYEKKSYHDEG